MACIWETWVAEHDGNDWLFGTIPQEPMSDLKPVPFHALRNFGKFLLSTLANFRANQGVLLSGAVAYHTLLSIVPIFLLVLVALTHIVDEEELLVVISGNIELILPGQSRAIAEDIATFLEHRELVGWLGMGAMLFFSSVAFTVLENAMSVIFHHRVAIRRRHFVVSAILPYLYIMLVGLGLLLITLISGALQILEGREIVFFAWPIQLGWLTSTALYFLGMVGMILLLTAIYMGMPVGRISIRHAFLGGVTAGILWEVVRHILIWYFSTISLVNIIYGSLASAIVALLSLEVAALILLFGAQVIAEYERLNRRGPSDGTDSKLQF
jgi:YihY family inner membrane protein